jgi:hypothetical protein
MQCHCEENTLRAFVCKTLHTAWIRVIPASTILCSDLLLLVLLVLLLLLLLVLLLLLLLLATN